MARKVVMVRIDSYDPAGAFKGRDTVRPNLACGHYSPRRFYQNYLPKRGKVGCKDCFKEQEKKRKEQAAKQAQQPQPQQPNPIQKIQQSPKTPQEAAKEINAQRAKAGQPPLPQHDLEKTLEALQKNPGQGQGKPAGKDPGDEQQIVIVPSTEAEQDEMMAKIEAAGIAVKGVGRDKNAKVAVQARKMANAEVGDFISDLMVAVKHKTEYDLTRGELLTDPVRGFTDGRAFAHEYRGESNGKLRVALVLDTSGSMFEHSNGQFWTAAPVFQKVDMMMREAQRNLPVGTLSYQPFVFHSEAERVPKAVVPWLCGGSWDNGSGGDPSHAPQSVVDQAILDGELPRGAISHHRAYAGGSTYVGDAFAKIRAWEEEDPNFDHSATRIDIVLTDGQFDRSDVKEASDIQNERGGKVISVLLNFCEPEDVQHSNTPERCTQYAVDQSNLTARVRQILEDAIKEL